MKQQPLRIFDLLSHFQSSYPNHPIYSFKEKDTWIQLSSNEFIDKVNQVSKGLLACGIQPGDKVGLISENRIEWSIIDFAIQQIGAIVVAVYPNISDVDYVYIFNHAEIKLAITSNTHLFERINNLRSDIPTLQHQFILDKNIQTNNWQELILEGNRISDEELIQISQNVTTDDLATIIYTSGTTGHPKGVMLTHKNLLADMMSSEYSFPVTSYQRALSFLPACHAYERLFHYVYLYKGLTIYYAQSLDTIGEDMKTVKPHIFSAVPRVLEKVYDKIMATGETLTGLKRKLFFWAIELGEQYKLENRSSWYDFKLSIARKLIFSKWRAALGGEILGISSGSATLQEKLIRIYLAAGINIYEGYGLTEAGPCLAVNDFQRGMKIGTVGLPLINLEIKLAEDGEILTKGDNVMKGYYKDQAATDLVIIDGWLHTGDIGEWIDDKYLKIIDRKKEMFKTSGGKYVVPQAIESKMVESPFIEQFMVVGENQKYPAAFVVPSYKNLFEWAKTNAISLLSLPKEEFLKNNIIEERIYTEIEKINKQFGKWEQIKKFAILPDEFTIEGGELTPTLKMKRKIIIQKYKQEYDSLF